MMSIVEDIKKYTIHTTCWIQQICRSPPQAPFTAALFINCICAGEEVAYAIDQVRKSQVYQKIAKLFYDQQSANNNNS